MSYRAIIVDDEVWSVANTKSVFPWEQYDFEIPFCTTNVHSAIDYIVENQPDVLFTDIKMPGFSGLDLIRSIRQRGLKIKIVVISGYADFSYAQESIKYGVFSYLLKPVDSNAAKKLMLDLKNSLEQEQTPAHQTADYQNFSSQSFKRLVQYVDKHYIEKLQLSELAEQFQINASYCSQLFVKHFDCSFSEYVVNLKMQKASELLLKSEMWISEIADFLHYDYVYFNKIFKKHFGVTPKLYRQQGGNSE